MKKGYKRLSQCFLLPLLTSWPPAAAVAAPDAGDQAGGSSDGTFTASGETLNVGVQSNIISIPTVYAEEQGYFDELGLDVNLIMFPNGSPENEGLAAEQLDVASNGWLRFIHGFRPV